MKLPTALRLGRVSNLPTVSSDVLAGLALAGWGATSLSTIVRLCAALSLLYVGGMFLNDACDATVDARERPERPIPAGQATRAEVLGWSAALLLAGIGLAFSTGWRSGLAALLTAGTIVLYDLLHKRTRAAPALMGLCRMGVYWTAALSVSSLEVARVFVGGLVLFAYVLGLTYAAARENTTALVRWGPLVGLWAPALLAAPHALEAPIRIGVLTLFVGWTARGTRLVRSRDPPAIRRGIAGLIAGIALLDALWLAYHGPSLLPALAAVAAFALTLVFQRYVPGT